MPDERAGAGDAAKVDEVDAAARVVVADDDCCRNVPTVETTRNSVPAIPSTSPALAWPGLL